MSRVVLLLFACFLSGCASMTTGQNQTVSVTTPDCPQASCVLTNNDGEFHVSRTPGTTMVNKSCSALTVECSKPGFPDHVERVKAGFQAMTAGNVLIGGLIGIGVDAATGAACKYPSVIKLEMTCAPTNDSPESEVVDAAPVDSDIPTHVWHAAFNGLCGDVEPIDDGGEGEARYSAVCQSEPTLITCVDEECELSDYPEDSGDGNGSRAGDS